MTIASHQQYFEPGSIDISFFHGHGIEEPNWLSVAVKKRRSEFLWGRYCAAMALKRCGSVETHVAVGAHRNPIWPASYCGSITHTAGFAAAMVGKTSHYQSIGIDAEKIVSKSTRKIEKFVYLPGEREQLMVPEKLSETRILTAIFSAKESLYKALFPIVGKFFGFSSAKVDQMTLDHFRITLQQNLPPFSIGDSFLGRYSMTDHILMSTVLIKNDHPK